MNGFPALEQLFAGHLHEDWADDYVDYLHPVDAFVVGQPSYAAAALSYRAWTLTVDARLDEALHRSPAA